MVSRKATNGSLKKTETILFSTGFYHLLTHRHTHKGRAQADIHTNTKKKPSRIVWILVKVKELKKIH